MNLLPMLQAAANGAAGGPKTNMWLTVIIYVVLLGGLFYFMLIRPQKKQQKQMEDLHSQIKPGDNIMTTGGFYGTVLDIVDDTVIVEFGNNKNCRIPMHKNAIAEIDRGDVEEEEAEEEKPAKKGLFGKKKDKDKDAE